MKTARSLLALCTAACLAAIPVTTSAEPAATGNDGSVQKPEGAAQPAVAPGMLTAGQQEKQRAVINECQARIDDLQDKMMQKQLELDYLTGLPDVKADEIKAAIADLVKLHKEAREADREWHTRLREAGLEPLPQSGTQRPAEYDPNGYPVPRDPWSNGYWQSETPMPGLYWENGQDGYAPGGMGN